MILRSPQGDALPVEALDQFAPSSKTSADSGLTDLTRLTARICNCPVAAVMLLEGSRKSYGAVFGTMLVDQDEDQPAFHRTMQAVDEEIPIYEVPDAYLDDAYSETGIAIGGHVYRFYAGTPLVTPEGAVLGALFVVDAITGRLDPLQQDALTVLGRQAVTRIQLISSFGDLDLADRVRQRTDTALTVERNFVSAVLDTVGALVAVFDTAGRIVRFNRACETISGYSSAELVGRYVWETLIPKEDVANAMREFEGVRRGRFPAAFENYWLTRDGRLRRIAWSATALLDAQEEVAFIIATGIDVTIQREAEETLVESERRYRQIVEGSLGMICTHDVDAIILSVNRNGAETIGKAIDEMIGHSLAEFLPEGAVTPFRDYLAKVTEAGEAEGLMHLRHVDGSIRVVAYRNKMVTTPGYEPHVLAFGVDVTDKVRAEAELRMLVRQSNSVLESVGDGIYGLDLEGRVTVVNAAATEMLGYTQGEMMGRSMHDAIHHRRTDGSEFSWQDCPIHASLKNMETIRVSTEVFWRKDGSSFPVDYVARPQIDTDTRGSGKAVGVVVAFTDTTERRALDRMKDEFVSTVSHELRTPLTSLRASLGLVQSGALSSRPEKAKQMLDIAIGNTDRLVRLVNEILDLERIQSSKDQLHRRMCNMDELLRRAAAMCQPDAEKAGIQFEIQAGNVEAWADPDRIMQAVTNLISNAIKFSPNGGKVVLKAAYAGTDEVEIEVRDSGLGIPEAMLERIFERFQQGDSSDARAIGGTGLGLAICRAIVLSHAGRIWATSEPGEGASFLFTLPRTAKQSLR